MPTNGMKNEATVHQKPFAKTTPIIHKIKNANDAKLLKIDFPK